MNLKKKLKAALSTLPPREQEVLKMRFGLEGDSLTTNEVSLYFNVPEKKVRQAEVRALRRLQKANMSLA